MNDYYKNTNGDIFSFSPLQISQGLADGLTPLTSEEVEELLKPKEPTSEEIRQKRNQLLTASDWTQVNDSPLSQELKAEWTEYRQYLRDIPQQEGFPNIEVKSFEEFQQDLE